MHVPSSSPSIQSPADESRAPASRRVVILSPGGEFTSDVLALLAERGIEVEALMLYLPSAVDDWRSLRGALRRVLTLPAVPLRSIRRRVRRRMMARPARGMASVVLTGAANGPRMVRDLRRIEPDVVVLARCGLIHPDVLAIPPGGVVNVHPGLLPWIRGNSPLGNSLLRQVPLGGTAFRVDAGIDTGPILGRRVVPVRGGETVAELRAALYRLWVEMTADLVAAASAGELPPGLAQPARFPLCRTISGSAQIAAMDESVRRGIAKTLFDRWRPLCDPSDLSLPADADAPFVAQTLD